MRRDAALMCWLVVLTGMASLCTVGTYACPPCPRAPSRRRTWSPGRRSAVSVAGEWCERAVHVRRAWGHAWTIALIHHHPRGRPPHAPSPAGAASAASRVVEEALAQKRLVIFSKTYSPCVHTRSLSLAASLADRPLTAVLAPCERGLQGVPKSQAHGVRRPQCETGADRAGSTPCVCRPLALSR
jgi:hypothetical protein